MKESIYNDNLQRTLVVGLIQERINYLEIRITKYSDKKCTEYKNDYDELNSLKDFLLWNS